MTEEEMMMQQQAQQQQGGGQPAPQGGGQVDCNALQQPVMEGMSVTVIDLMIALQVGSPEEVGQALQQVGEQELQQLMQQIEQAKQQDSEQFEQATQMLMEQLGCGGGGQPAGQPGMEQQAPQQGMM